ncbi:MAG: tetratricopeptide repeat protein [Elusimicrobiota bacterium]
MSVIGIAFLSSVIALNVLFPLSGKKDFNYWFQKGVSTESSDKKIEYFTEAIKSWKVSSGVEIKAEAYYNRGAAYGIKTSYDSAINDFSEAIKLNLKYAESYAARGNVYDCKGLLDNAVYDYNMAIELNPNLAGAYNNRGIVYDDKGMYNEAISDYSRAIMLKPGYAKAYRNRGVSYYKKGFLTEAKRDFETAKKEGFFPITNTVSSDLEISR